MRFCQSSTKQTSDKKKFKIFITKKNSVGIIYLVVADFCPKSPILAHFDAIENFLGVRKPPETRRRTHKIFWQVP